MNILNVFRIECFIRVKLNNVNMKNTIVILCLLLTAGYSQAQKLKEADVLANVKTAFTKKFPSAKKVSWSKEGADEFEAEFTDQNSEKSATFDTKGNWTTFETVIDKTALPSPVTASLAKEFAGYKIQEAERFETPTSSLYEVTIKKDKSEMEVQISADGKVVKKEESKEGDEKN
jgi:hypothetical protein